MAKTLKISQFNDIWRNTFSELSEWKNKNDSLTTRATTHLHHAVSGALVSELPQAVDEALAGLAVDPARLHHGMALFHKLDDTNKQWRGQIPSGTLKTTEVTNRDEYLNVTRSYSRSPDIKQ